MKEELSQLHPFKTDELFFIYPVKSDYGVGLVFIDKTKGVYPLFFYADGEEEVPGNRVEALKKTIETISEENIFNSLMEILENKQGEWDVDLQEALMGKYPSKKYFE